MLLQRSKKRMMRLWGKEGGRGWKEGGGGRGWKEGGRVGRRGGGLEGGSVEGGLRIGMWGGREAGGGLGELKWGKKGVY